MTHDLAKFDPIEARIAAVRADPIVADVLANIANLTASEDREAIESAKRLVVPLRTLAGRVKDELKRDAIDWGRAVDKKYRSTVDAIAAELERPLDNALAEIKAAEWNRAQAVVAEQKRKEAEAAAAVKAENERLVALVGVLRSERPTEVIPQPAPRPRPCEHQWGTDGAHTNVFCKKCFANHPNHPAISSTISSTIRRRVAESATVTCE